jgi:hypothetical protein
MLARKVFLSYRREESAAAAGRLSDRLTLELGSNSVFMDVDGIPLGADFVKRLTDEVAGCDVLLAIIGPRWLDAVDEGGDRRLDNPNDFVRVEIAAALHRDIPVIPILLDGTKIPRADRLPADLSGLSRRHGLDLRQASFHSDVGRLIRELKANEPDLTGILGGSRLTNPTSPISRNLIPNHKTRQSLRRAALWSNVWWLVLFLVFCWDPVSAASLRCP